MEKNTKFSKASLLYIFSMFLGITIIVLGFSVANGAKKEINKQTEANQNIQQQMSEMPKSAVVSNTPEKIEKEPETEVVVVEQKDVAETDKFAPVLEDYIITKPVNGEVLNSFTGKSFVYSPYFDDWCVHKGIDISAAESSQVKAAANGIVKSVYKDSRIGTVIVIEHGDFTTLYGNLSTGDMVSAGDEVYAGDIISGVGKSKEGKSFLHFEIEYKGEDIDPEPLLE